jgi:hypothetical protein
MPALFSGDSLLPAPPARCSCSLAMPAKLQGLIESNDIAEEACIYAFPMIAAYEALYEFNVDKASSQYKVPFGSKAAVCEADLRVSCYVSPT